MNKSNIWKIVIGAVSAALGYIQPDYCVSDISLFESFIRPNGDESKSMLGKVEGLPRRIRAKKFTLSKEPNGDPVYSNGILLPYNEVVDYVGAMVLENVDLTKKLGIIVRTVDSKFSAKIMNLEYDSKK